jgi:hypothetical protein
MCTIVLRVYVGSATRLIGFMNLLILYQKKKFRSQLGRHNHGFKRMIEYGLFRKENEKFCLKETSLKIYRSS